jgi:hypothetical protein
MRSQRRTWRWVAACAGGAIMLQTSGCALDASGLIAQIVTLTLNAILQSLLGSLTV